MIDYVRICPRCEHINNEDVEICGGPNCNPPQFLGMVNPVPRPLKMDPPPPPPPPNPPKPSGSAGEVDTGRKGSAGPGTGEGRVTERLSTPVVYLQCPQTSQTFEIQPGQIVGQKHPTSTAHVQLEGIPNLNFVSRDHCRFDHENGEWYVTALETSLNRTCVNRTLVPKGTRARIRNGDQLVLADVSFQVRILLG
jgi:hypothetical protein